jgi:hypothetical protein
VPFPERLFKNYIIWREGFKGGINMDKWEEKQLHWFGHEKNEWDKDTEKGARFKI